MRVIKCAVTIGEDHTLHVQLPADVPPGPAEVTVEIPEHSDEGSAPEGMLNFLDTLKDRPWRLRSKAEIDAELRELRDSWREP